MCGIGKLFQNWFRMNTDCTNCGATFQREAGFFLGSIYFNYGLTALVIAIAYPVLLFNELVPKAWLMPCAMVFALLFPIWFFRYARALWLGFDQFCDPRQEEAPSEESPNVGWAKRVVLSKLRRSSSCGRLRASMTHHRALPVRMR